VTLPFDVSPACALWLAVAVFGAALIRRYSGFGYSALVITASSLVTNPPNFVAAVVALEMVMSVQAWRGTGRDIDRSRVGWLVGGAAVGLPLGLWALTAIWRTRHAQRFRDTCF
jgi:hypothetical protein